jgi:membrane protease YdiL (CAAX protease family)
MTSEPVASEPVPSESVPAEPVPAAPAVTGTGRFYSVLRWPFLGRAGLRSGWRVLAFFLLFIAASELLERRLPGGDFTPGRLLLRESVLFAAVLAITLLMGALERRPLGEYGLPWPPPLAGVGWGSALGFLALTFLMVSLWLVGALRFAEVVLPPAEILSFAVGWAIVFVTVGLFEELLLRGYPLTALARGIGFWAGAIVLSAIFAAMHARNSGETPLGLAAVFGFGLFFALMRRRAGSLWPAIGFHASWDWGESFFYGVANSGTVVQGQLLRPAWQGADWLTGGSAGPEGSVLILATLALAALAVARRRPARVGPPPEPFGS